ncbi:hypothetical protein FO519_003848 [Halicephalobus sp. NKZ332]|nr:hypothetical protein FO519_003848 [Halicephalobus sp. NKZ332]
MLTDNKADTLICEEAKLKVGIIGFGKRGKEYFNKIEGNSEMIVVAICDVMEPEITSIPTFTNLDEMITSVPMDIGVVCVPHNQHFEACEKLMKNGIHVIKEKPFALSSEEAEKLHNLAKENNVQIIIGTQRRFFPAYKKCKELIENGTIGTVSAVDIRYTLNHNCPNPDNWRTQESADIILDMGYHMLDVITWMFGAPEEVYGLQNERNHYEKIKAGNSATITFRKFLGNEKYTIGNVFLVRYFHKKEEQFTVIGTKGTIVIKDGKEFVYLDSNQEMKSEVFENDSHSTMLHHFVDAVKGKQELRSSSSNHMETMKFVDSVRKVSEATNLICPVMTPISNKNINLKGKKK